MERIRLSNQTFEGSNNAYLFADGPETVLVDTGDRVPDTRAQLKSKLADHGVGFPDIDRIFLTHWHGDHRGLAGHIQQESDAAVYVHEADAPLVAGDPDAWEAMVDRQQQYFEQWGMPDEKREEVTAILDSVAWRENPPSVTTIADGDKFVINGTTFRTVHAPGHTAGLCMFETTVDGENAVLTGDALLPKYTPNVGGADIRVDRPLPAYLQTLQAIADADYDRAWPGHRDPIDDPTARADHIVNHHEHRTWRVLSVLEEHGPCDAWTVSDHLFGNLEHIHILHGPGEAFAHLSHLEEEELIERVDDQYDLAAGTGGRLDAIDDERFPLVE
jgi:glyoxylase-like metal-dependent hydrolase (beta-lactamase superfamily II)